MTIAADVDGERLPTLFIPHGGGPWPFMDGLGPKGTWDGLAAHLRGLDAAIGRRPKAVLMISGHWEEPRPTVAMGPHPALLFDYYGFPEHTYRLKYPAPGATDIAVRTRLLLEDAGIVTAEDPARDYDHGVFIPLMLVYPDADVPIAQLSLRADLDPEAHLAIGRALAPLRDQGVLIVGSGMSYHNLRAFFARDTRADQASERFDDWLTDAVEAPDAATRDGRLARWAEAPDALTCHPRSEHLVPLFVAAGAAGEDRGQRVFNDRILGKMISGYRFG